MLTTSLVNLNDSLDFQVQNPLPISLQILSINSTAGVDGNTFIAFTHSFEDFVIPAGGSASSGTVGNATLTEGVIATLDIIPEGILDVNSTLGILYVVFSPLFFVVVVSELMGGYLV